MTVCASQSLFNAKELGLDIVEFVDNNKNNYKDYTFSNGRIRLRDFSKYHGYYILDQWIELTATHKTIDFNQKRLSHFNEQERDVHLIRMIEGAIRGIYSELAYVIDLVNNEYLIEWLKSVYILSPGKNIGSNTGADIKKEWTNCDLDIEIKSCHKNANQLRFSKNTCYPLVVGITYEHCYRKKYSTFSLKNVNTWKSLILSRIPEYNIIKRMENRNVNT